MHATQVTEWIQILTETAAKALRGWKRRNTISRWQARVARFYESDLVQTFVAIMIAASFCTTAAELQLHPCVHDPQYQPGDKEYCPKDEETPGLVNLFVYLEYAFIFFFLVELIVNACGHWFQRFVRNPWSLFDTLVVGVSLLALSGTEVPVIYVYIYVQIYRYIYIYTCISSPLRDRGACV